ncbi:MAG TPA: VOC family protein [Acidimicrobiales bacterium]|jgi:catechol 2,3-dioxygenase-like lactoylglutathione lyase family enzyme|nr:VOC family protein [Acidimicrobiales bacterium]
MTDVKLTEPRLTHVALPVSDLDASIAFYTELCNLVCVAQNEDENGRGAWLSNDKQVKDPFVLVLAEFLPEVGERFGQTPGEKVPTLTPFAHVGIELPTREDVDRMADKAREMGCLQWEPRDMAAHIGYICAALDPDGNVVEFSHNQKVFSTIRDLWGNGS